MKAWKSKLSEEDRWKLVLFERNFGLKGKEYDPAKKEWVSIGSAAPAAAGAAPAGEGAAPGAPVGGAGAAPEAGK
jgi:hypothetical protein